jgi:hypothetical protein
MHALLSPCSPYVRSCAARLVLVCALCISGQVLRDLSLGRDGTSVARVRFVIPPVMAG